MDVKPDAHDYIFAALVSSCRINALIFGSLRAGSTHSPCSLCLQDDIAAARQLAQDHLDSFVAVVPKAVGMHGTAHRLLQAAAAAPQPSLQDFAQLALEQSFALSFNPFLSEKSVARLQRSARVWLQLCVLEDRLRRLACLAGEDSARATLMQELETHREWSVDEHPAWLVFEVRHACHCCCCQLAGPTKSAFLCRQRAVYRSARSSMR